MSDLKQQLIQKARHSTSLLGRNSYSSYWQKWVNNFDFLNSADDVKQIYGDYFTPVRWMSNNFILRLLVNLELLTFNFLSSPKYFLKAICKSSYWRLRKVCLRQGRHMNFTNVIALNSFNLLCSRINLNLATICVIGDGASNFVSMCLEESTKFAKIVSINLAEIHMVETEMLLRAGISESQMILVDSEQSARGFLQASAKIAIVSADDVQSLANLKIDIFVNMSSMQEMTAKAISEYFELIKKSSSYFYCCNREEKKLPDGSIVKFFEYPWTDARFLLNEICPWINKTFNLTRPIIRRQEIHRHALVKFD